MNVPTPMNDTARDDRFNRGLERLLDGDPTGIDEIDPELQDIAIQMVQLANQAGWIGMEPGDTPIRPRHWWNSGQKMLNAIAAVALIGLVGALVAFGLRVWDMPNGQYGSEATPMPPVELGPGVCSRAPRTDAEIAAIVRKSEDEAAPFRSNGINADVINSTSQLTRDWNACLLAKDWKRAMAYESDFFIWLLGQEEFQQGTTGISDKEIASRISERHTQIVPLRTSDGMNLAIYTAEYYRMNLDSDELLILGTDIWLVPVNSEGDWIEWPTVVTVEWNGARWVIVSATRDGVPDSEYFRDDTLPKDTPESQTDIDGS